jgi:hypothetical protein
VDTGVLGLGAVAWSDAWNATSAEAGLRLTVDPARLLELLRGTPVSRALMADLQRAAAAGHSVELIASPDRQVVEIATGAGHYVLTVAARNSVMPLLQGRAGSDAVSGRPGSATTPDRPDVSLNLAGAPRASSTPGILWEPPSAASREQTPSQFVVVPWMGQQVQLEVKRDGAGGRSGDPDGLPVTCATLKLQLPALGRVDATIRLCGSAVAISLACDRASVVESHLALLQQRLSARGLSSAHVGLAPARSP